MRLLVTGAAGMLGQDVVLAALAAGHEVFPYPRAELDVTDRVAVAAALARTASELIVNCAAYTNVDGAETDRARAMAVNARGPEVLGAAAAAAGAWCLHVSTDYVFDGRSEHGYVESDATAPQSVYGESKLAGELALASAAPAAHTIVRTAWLFGNHGPCFPATMLRLAGEREVLNVVDDQIGCPTFTPHLAVALLALAATPATERPVGVLHIAAAGQCSWYEFAAATLLAAGAKAQVEPCGTAEFPRPAKRPAFSVLRSERGAPVLPEWQQGLVEYLAARSATIADGSAPPPGGSTALPAGSATP